MLSIRSSSVNSHSYTEVLDTTLIIIMLKILMRVRNITMWDKNRGKIRLIMIMFGSSDSVLNFDPIFALFRGTKRMKLPWILQLQSMARPRLLPSLPEKQATASICWRSKCLGPTPERKLVIVIIIPCIVSFLFFDRESTT